MIPLPNQTKVIEKKGNKAIFEITPFYPGYGMTVGNNYRRVLLSSLEGAAITEVKIKGVTHEFFSLPGVLEDIVMILINLKKLRFKNWSDEPQIITLGAKGEKEVKARDFKLTPQVKLANPEAHIATLTSKSAELQIEAKIEKGIGYLSTEEREEKKATIGVIPIDAIFTPVKKVSFKIENVIVGKRTDFERLELEIETDGTISPEEAYSGATDILLEHFSLFSKFGQKKEEKEAKEEAEKKKERKKKKVPEEEEGMRAMKIEDLKVSERTKNALLKNNIKTIGGILRKSEKDILSFEGMGEKGLKEIKKVLKKFDLELKE